VGMPRMQLIIECTAFTFQAAKRFARKRFVS